MKIASKLFETDYNLKRKYNHTSIDIKYSTINDFAFIYLHY
jgi:hypothetical protein